jgi:hypothetical protein
MSNPLRLVATMLMCVGLTSCVRTTEGSVAMTTEPGGSTSTSTSSSASPTTSRTRTSSPQSTSEVPAPAGAMTMKCDEFTKLDQAERVAVVKEIVSQENSPFGQLGDEFAETMASTMCQFMPDATVREVLMGSTPP